MTTPFASTTHPGRRSNACDQQYSLLPQTPPGSSAPLTRPSLAEPHEHHRPGASRQARLRGPRKELGPCGVTKLKAIVGCVRSPVGPVGRSGRQQRIVELVETIVKGPAIRASTFAIKNKDEAKVCRVLWAI